MISLSDQSHYPGYNVLEQAEAWDEHSREIVKRRLESTPEFQFFNCREAELFGAVAATIIDDQRPAIVNYISGHADNRLAGKIGESQRKVETPPESQLIRNGLKAIDFTAKNDYQKPFNELTPAQRQNILGRVERGELPNSGPWQGLPQKDLFAKILNLSVEAYYSHPTVWSEIGYGGPAYPRGYVRVELGLIDPWEARSLEEC
ncbi:MAG: gluconate 2-dehydrogenase subunit 3 family protein [Bacillota bacterium]